MDAPVIAVFLRRLGGQWFVIHGAAGGNYTRDYYRRNGSSFEDRAAAFCYAHVLARSLGIEPDAIVEDMGIAG